MNRERTNRSANGPRKNMKSGETDQKRSVRGQIIEKRGTGSADTKKKYTKRSETDSRKSSGNRTYEKRDSGSTDAPKKYTKRTDTDFKRHSGSRPYEKRDSGSTNAPRKYRKRIELDANNDVSKKTTGDQETGTGEIRLNKYLAASGICSRREADKFIKAGLVSVNGQIITELGTKVNKSDNVRYNGERLKSERPVYILLNKPKDYITTLRDPHAKRTVMELIQNACKERVYPVGRLDRNTTGVLLLTNDGELAKQLSHPSSNKLKIYHVTLDKSLTKTDFQKIIEGFNLEDGFIKADELSYIDQNDKKEIGIEIHSGRNHIVRRIFEYLGYNVRKLDRVYFAGLTKKGLERGKYRFLTEKEVGILKMGSYQ